MTQGELDAKIDRLHREGKRGEVVTLMRKYGLFTDEDAVRDYLSGRDA